MAKPDGIPPGLHTTVGGGGLNFSGPGHTVTMYKHHFLRVVERMQRREEGAPRTDAFYAALTGLLAVVLAEVTTNFRGVLGIPADTWQAFWLFVGAGCLGVVVVQGWRLWRYRRDHKPQPAEAIYQEVLAEMARDQEQMDAAERRSVGR